MVLEKQKFSSVEKLLGTMKIVNFFQDVLFQVGIIEISMATCELSLPRSSFLKNRPSWNEPNPGA